MIESDCYQALLRVSIVRLLISLFLVVSVSDVAAAPALPGESCPVVSRIQWTKTERWVWHQICGGRIADLNERDHPTLNPFDIPFQLDPTTSHGWNEERQLSSDFLETILIHDPWRSALPRQGVRILGARFVGKINLAGAKLKKALWLDKSRFEQVDMEGLHAEGRITFEKSLFAENLKLAGVAFDGGLSMVGAKVTKALMHSATIGQNLLMKDGEFADVILSGAKVTGRVDMTGAKVTGTVDMENVTIGSDLYMRSGAEFGTVKLNGAQMGGQVELIGAKVTDTLDMDYAAIRQSLLMSGAEFGDVTLRGAQIGGTLNLTNSKVAYALNMDNAYIGETLFMRNGDFGKRAELRRFSLMPIRDPIRMVFAEIAHNLDLRGAMVGTFNLTGTRIAGELSLAGSGHGVTTWRNGARLVLRNSSTGALRAAASSWPEHLNLDGFTYTHLCDFGCDDASSPIEVEDYLDKWLARDRPPTMQPYEQLAKVLREAGRGEEANDILYGGREALRTRSLEQCRSRSDWLPDEHCWSWFGQSLLWFSIGYGYGYRYFWSLWCVLGFVVFGVMVLIWFRQAHFIVDGFSGGNRAQHATQWVPLTGYSLDMLLPIIQLRRKHEEAELDGIARYYFYLHKVAGYVLAGFLIAGLAGITK